MKQIEVVAAIIYDAEGRIFATQRGYGEWQDYWEFPGGKIEPGETPEEALRREIWEELATLVVVEQLIQTIEYDYPIFHLTMHCYRCRVKSGNLTLKEHEAAQWLTTDKLDGVNWLPADWQIIETLKKDYTTSYISPIGTIMLSSNGTALTRLRISSSTDSLSYSPNTTSHPIFDEACRWLEIYFRGQKPDFTPLLKPIGSDFQQTVWRELLTIPYGQTVSYGDIAHRIDCHSAQAVGGAVGRNPIAIIIPCHRVIGSNGSLTGYAYGIERKQYLLKLEQSHYGK